MRRGFAILAVLAVCGAAPSLGQPHPPGPKGPLGAILGPHRHPPPAPANPQHTPTVYLDATGLGSPVTLDKNWRVGITANPAAAMPDFDDSAWAVRNASESIEDVPDEDHPADAPPGPDHQATASAGTTAITSTHLSGFACISSWRPVTGRSPSLCSCQSPTPPPFPWAAEARALTFLPTASRSSPKALTATIQPCYQPISRIYRLNVSPDATSMVLGRPNHLHPRWLRHLHRIFREPDLHPGPRRRPEPFARAVVESLPVRTSSAAFCLHPVCRPGHVSLRSVFAQKGHREYLWLALHELAQAPLAFLEIAGITARIDELLYAALFLELIVISAYLYFEFLVAFLDLPHRWGKAASAVDYPAFAHRGVSHAGWHRTNPHAGPPWPNVRRHPPRHRLRLRPFSGSLDGSCSASLP